MDEIINIYDDTTGKVLMSGYPLSLRMTFNKLTGVAFSHRRSFDDGTHAEYLSFMERFVGGSVIDHKLDLRDGKGSTLERRTVRLVS